MKSSRLSLLLAAATLVAASSAHAATITKAGSGTNLADSASWTGGVLPGTADQATFDNTSLTGSLTVDSVPPTAWQQMLFGSTTPASDIAAAITLSGSKITLLNSGDNHVGAYTLKSASSKAVTINNAIDFTGTSRNTIRVDGAGILTLAGTLNFSGTGNTIFRGTDGRTGVVSGVIANAAGQVQVTDNTNWTFSGLNTYTTKTSINGSLTINSIKNVGGGASSLGAVTTIANGTIDLGSSVTSTLKYTGTATTTDRVINLVGTDVGVILDQSGTGLLKFTGGVTATGAGSKTLTLQGSTGGTGEISGAIVDNSVANKTSVNKTGSGTWTLSGVNTYTGATTVNAGILIVANNNALGAGSAANSIAANATLTVNNGITLAQTGVITMLATGNTTTGRSTINLNGTATISNNIQLDYSGLTGAGNAFAQISGTGAGVFNGSVTFAAGKASTTGANNIFVLRGSLGTAKATGTIDLLTGNSSGSGTLRIVDLTTDWEISGSNNRWTTLDMRSNDVTQKIHVGAVNTLSAEGVLTNSDSGVGNWISTVNLNNIADTAGFSQTIAGIQDGANGKVAVTSTKAATLTIGGSGTYASSGIISGLVAVTKNGAGQQTLSGANTYTGGTEINGGTLLTGNASALGTGAVTVGGGTLQVGATNITGIASLTVNSGVLDTSAGGVTLAGAFTLAGGTWTVGSTLDGVTLTSGSFALTGGTIDLGLLSLFDKQNSGFSLISGTGVAAGLSFINGDTGFSYSLDTNGDLLVTAVPEPSTYGLMGAGALAAAAMVRRRRKAAAKA